jgi:hypothetical protein
MMQAGGPGSGRHVGDALSENSKHELPLASRGWQKVSTPASAIPRVTEYSHMDHPGHRTTVYNGSYNHFTGAGASDWHKTGAKLVGEGRSGGLGRYLDTHFAK